MSPSQLAYQARVGRGTISKIVNQNQKVWTEILVAIARALRLPPEYVFEKAELLPTKCELSPTKRSLAYLAKELPDSDLEMVIALFEQRLEYYQKHPKTRPAE